MNWFIILLMISFFIIFFCFGYILGLNKNKELDKKYFNQYKKDMEFISRLEKGEKPIESDFI